MTEPFPWSLELAAVPIGDDMSCAAYEPIVFEYLSTLYNNNTVAPWTTFSRDHVRNTYLLRYTLSLPVAGDAATPCWSSLSQFPGAIFYSLGKRRFVCDLVAANASSRLAMKLHQCQHNRLFGVTVVDACTWVQPGGAAPNEANSTLYTVYHAGQVWGGRSVCWTKLGCRVALSVFVGFVLWRSYYRHYVPLLHNLRTIGLSCNANEVTYVVDLGDPTWIVLSHPIVVVAMVVDCFVGAAYLGVASIRVSQLTDVPQFALGCLYGSRTVWAAYLTMRLITPLVKRRGWENHFEALDPGMMALMASIYAGPMVYTACNTPMLLVFQPLLTAFVPAKHANEAVDSELVTLSLLMLLAAVPLLQSVVAPKVLARLHKREPPDAPRNFASMRFNDVKQRCLFSVAGAAPVSEEVGGSLHALVNESARFLRLPLFSPRGADCFVQCIPADDTTATRQIRLSLVHSVKAGHATTPASITGCGLHTAHPHLCLSAINAVPCTDASKSPALPSMRYLHVGAMNCQWMM